MPEKTITELHREIAQLEHELAERKKYLNEIRRRLPQEEVEDYTFRTRNNHEIKLSDMFGGHKELILIHNMGTGCAYCTMWADGFNGIIDHLENRAAFVLISPDEPQTQRDFADGRGWRFKMHSCHGSPFAKDLGFQDEKGSYRPGVSVFRKADDGRIYRVGYTYFGPGDDFCSVWHLFELLPNGPDGWAPKFSY